MSKKGHKPPAHTLSPYDPAFKDKGLGVPKGKSSKSKAKAKAKKHAEYQTLKQYAYAEAYGAGPQKLMDTHGNVENYAGIPDYLTQIGAGGGMAALEDLVVGHEGSKDSMSPEQIDAIPEDWLDHEPAIVS